MVKVGDKVVRRPVSFGETAENKKTKPQSGIVVYVHPKGRFHTVKFDKGIRESFLGIAKSGG